MLLQSRGESGATEGLDVRLGHGGKNDTGAGPLLKVKKLDNVVRRKGHGSQMMRERRPTGRRWAQTDK